MKNQLRTVSALALVALLGPALACGGPPAGNGGDAGSGGPDAADVDAADDPGARTYRVRGEVTAVPDPADPLSDLRIRHEAIDDFVGIDDEVVGMSSMTMPFPVAPQVPVADLAVGDKVAFTLAVDWDGEPAYQITEIEELPAGTELEFRKARPPEPEEEATEGDTGAGEGAGDDETMPTAGDEDLG